MKLSIRKKMLMLGAICFISMLATFAIFITIIYKEVKKLPKQQKI